LFRGTTLSRLNRCASITAGACAVLLALAAGPARAIPLLASSDVQAGMTGYGLSVFKGTKIERFSVSVIGVMRNAFPKMDMILIRCSGANLEHSGIVAGMSGSPIYLTVDGQDRLIGALAYGWMFSKDPIAGVTPIHAMLDEAKRPLRESLVAGTSSTPRGDIAGNVGPEPPAQLQTLLSHPQLKAAMTPLFVSGGVGPLLKMMAPTFEAWNFVPMQGGGAASPEAVRASEGVRLEPGSAIGVSLMRGDLEMLGVGTVTYRDGDTVLAFGHPMMGIGELRFPVTTAYVQHTFAGLARSFKMAGKLATVGTLVQDRRPTIVAKVGPAVPMIPLRVVVRNPMAKRQDVFQMEMVHHREFTPMLALLGMLNSVMTAASDNADVSFRTSVKVKLPGRAPIELRDHVYSPSGLLGGGLFASPVFWALRNLYTNPFEEVRAESVEYEIDLLFKRDLARIEAVELATDALRPGQKAKALLRLRPYLGKPYAQPIEIDVPESAAGSEIVLQFAGGPTAPIDVAPPDGFDDVVRNLGARHPSKSIVVSMQTPTQSFKFRGQNLTDLPRSAIEALSPQNAVGRGLVTGGLLQTVVPAQHVIVGQQAVRVRVKRLDE
jgi:hypothetical protein